MKNKFKIILAVIAGLLFLAIFYFFWNSNILIQQNDEQEEFYLYQSGSNGKVEINKLKTDIEDYYTNELNYKVYDLSEDIPINDLQKKTGGYQWRDIFQNEDSLYGVMFYLPTTISSTYGLFEFKLPSQQSKVIFKEENGKSLVKIIDEGMEIVISPIDFEEQPETYEMDKFMKISRYDISRYENQMDNGSYNYIYGKTSDISLEMNCGEILAPCGLFRFPFFHLSCVVEDQSRVTACDEVVNSIKQDGRTWSEFGELDSLTLEERFIPFEGQ